MMNQIMHDVIYQTKENIQMYTNPLRDTIQQIRRDIEMPDLAKNPFGLRVTIFESEENAVDLDDVCSVSSLDTIASIGSNQTEHSLGEQMKNATEEFYRLAQTKWKVFTFTLTSAVSVSYVSGLIMLGKLDTHEVSIQNRQLYMGMIRFYPGCRDNRDQIWRLLSNIFSHGSLSHFGGNIIGFFGFSYLLEMYQSAYVIAPLFFMGTIHGNLSFYYTKPYAFAIGVSQGVFAIVGMNMANILMNMYAYNRFHSYLIMYFCMTVVFSEMLSYDETNQIAYICHWTSGVSGLIGGMGWFTQHKPSQIGKYVSIGMRYLYLLYTAYWFYYYIFVYPPLQSYNSVFEPIETVNCCYERFQFEHDHPEGGNFTCPYKLTYEDNMPHSLYKS